MAPYSPLEDRFWAKVDKRSPHECWLWKARINVSGYGEIHSGPAEQRMLKAHRVSYELLVGPIPDGLQIDHLCRVRACVNPAHLEPVTSRVNTLRGETVAAKNAAKTHCPSGHEYTPENTWRGPRGRYCIPCRDQRNARARSLRAFQLTG